MAVINALVPLETVRHLLVPTIAAHLLSNSSTSLARDHTPLRMLSSNTFSSSLCTHIGHFTQLAAVQIGLPPRIAGVRLMDDANELLIRPDANKIPAVPNE